MIKVKKLNDGRGKRDEKKLRRADDKKVKAEIGGRGERIKEILRLLEVGGARRRAEDEGRRMTEVKGERGAAAV